MRPPRPAMSDTTPPPVNLPKKPATALRVAARLWLLSAVIGIGAVVYRVVQQDSQLAHLRRMAGELQSDTSQAQIESVAQVAFWGTAGLLVIVFLVQAILVSPLQRGNGWARWLLLGLLVPNLLGLVLASVTFTDDSGLQLTPLLLTAQLVLAVVALFAALLPSSTRWFRKVRSERREALG